MRPRFKVSRAGLELIESFEGLRRRAARLPDGRWTIGYGHTLSAREGVEVSEADAEALLLYDLLPVVAAVNDLVTAEIVQHQFDALVAFAFSIGVEAFADSDVLRRVNEGRFAEAALAIEVWRNTRFDGRSVTLEALVRRRAAEAALFLGEAPWPTPTPRELLRPIVDAAAEAGLPRRPPARVEVDLEGETAAVRVYEELIADPAPEPAPEPEPGMPPEPPAAAEPTPAFTAAQAEAVARLLAADERGGEPETPPEAPPAAPEPPTAPAVAQAPEPRPTAASPSLASAAMSLRLHSPYPVGAAGLPSLAGGPLPVADPAPPSLSPAPEPEPEPAPEAEPEPEAATAEAASEALPEAAPPQPEPRPAVAPAQASADEAAPPPVLVLTSPPAGEPESLAEPEPSVEPEADTAEPAADQPPLFEAAPEPDPQRLLVHEAAPPPPSPGRWSDAGAFVGMGAVGLAALGAAVGAFQLAAASAPPEGQFDEKTGIAWALAIIGALLVGVSTYHLLTRIGGVED